MSTFSASPPPNGAHVTVDTTHKATATKRCSSMVVKVTEIERKAIVLTGCGGSDRSFLRRTDYEILPWVLRIYIINVVGSSGTRKWPVSADPGLCGSPETETCRWDRLSGTSIYSSPEQLEKKNTSIYRKHRYPLVTVLCVSTSSNGCVSDAFRTLEWRI